MTTAPHHPGYLTRLVAAVDTRIMPSHWRAPREDETCSCGRPALIVYKTDRFGEVPSCGI